MSVASDRAISWKARTAYTGMKYGFFVDRDENLRRRFLSTDGALTANIVGAFTEGSNKFFKAGSSGPLQRSVANDIASVKVCLNEAKHSIARNEKRSTHLEIDLQVEVQNLQFMESMIEGLLARIPAVAVKVETELGTWFNTVTGSLQHSNYHEVEWLADQITIWSMLRPVKLEPDF